MKRLLSYDEFTGISSYFEHDPHTGMSTITSVQDVEPALDANKAAQNDGTGGWTSKAREWRRAASIPIGVLEAWRTVDGIDWKNKDHLPRILQKLDDIEFRYLRTGLFKLGRHGT